MAQFICNFYSQYMDLLWLWNRKKKNKARHKIIITKIKKIISIRFIVEILILS